MQEPEISRDRVSSEEENDQLSPGRGGGHRQNRLVARQGSYFSSSLGRNQPFTYLLPQSLEPGWTGERRYPLLVLLHGRDSHHGDWVVYSRVARYLAPYGIVAVCPEGANGWYTNAFDGSARYEDDLIYDFLPHVQAHLPVVAPGIQWGIVGVSMGGYGAIKVALKHPHLFSVAVSHSGAFEKPAMAEAHPVFGDPRADVSFRRRENLYYLTELALSSWPAMRPRLHLDCGSSDMLLEANRRFKDHLTFIGYPHTYHEMPGHHTWPYWDRAFRTMLPTLVRELRIEMMGV